MSSPWRKIYSPQTAYLVRTKSIFWWPVARPRMGPICSDALANRTAGKSWNRNHRGQDWTLNLMARKHTYKSVHCYKDIYFELITTYPSHYDLMDQCWYNQNYRTSCVKTIYLKILTDSVPFTRYFMTKRRIRNAYVFREPSVTWAHNRRSIPLGSIVDDIMGGAYILSRFSLHKYGLLMALIDWNRIKIVVWIISKREIVGEWLDECQKLSIHGKP